MGKKKHKPIDERSMSRAQEKKRAAEKFNEEYIRNKNKPKRKNKPKPIERSSHGV